MYQNVIYRRDWLSFLAEVSTGVSALDSKLKSGFDHCDSFCVPNLAWHLSPGVGVMLRIHSGIGIQTAVRFDYLSDKDYPFTSGISAAIGLLLEHTQREVKVRD